MNLLALDTATDACSVAIESGDRILTRVEREPKIHSRRLLAMVDECLAESGLRLDALDGLVFGRGPGSFTGLRIACGVIQGLALGSGKPVVPVSSLAGHAVTAWRRHGRSKLAVCVDARMDECYWGTFELDSAGHVTVFGTELLAAPESLPAPEGEGWLGVGSGWQAYPGLRERLGPSVSEHDSRLLPEARDLLPIARRDLQAGLAVPAGQALPIYLRERVAWHGKPPSTG